MDRSAAHSPVADTARAFNRGSHTRVTGLPHSANPFLPAPTYESER
jgi:hypothetical protein